MRILWQLGLTRFDPILRSDFEEKVEQSRYFSTRPF